MSMVKDWLGRANEVLLLNEAARCCVAQGQGHTAMRLRAWADRLARGDAVDALDGPAVAEVPCLPSRPSPPLAAPPRAPSTSPAGGRAGPNFET